MGGYYNVIKKENTVYPFRFMTKDEFIHKYGYDWRTHIGWSRSTVMDHLLGSDFKIDTNLKDIDEIFINPVTTHNGNDYIDYYDNGGIDWVVCKLMITKNDIKKNFNYFYLKNKENIYENKQDIFSSDVFYRFVNDEDKENVLKFLEKEGFNIDRVSTNDKIVVICFYKNEKPEYVDNKIEIFGFRNMSDDELIRKNFEYNNGDYIFANSFDELIFYIRKKNITVKSIINKRMNIYESKKENILFDIFYRPKNKKDYNDTLEFLFKNGFTWDFGSDYDTEFEYVKCVIISFSDKNLYKYHEEYSDSFIIDDNYDNNDGNYAFANDINEVKRQFNFILKPIIYKYLNIRGNIYENTQIVRYSDFENLEYRKGSKEFGGIITKLLEFLRLYDTQEDLVFNIDDFVKKSNITIEEIQKLLHSKEIGQKLYDFEIVLDKNNILFKNLNKTGKNRPFESNNN